MLVFRPVRQRIRVAADLRRAYLLATFSAFVMRFGSPGSRFV